MVGRVGDGAGSRIDADIFCALDHRGHMKNPDDESISRCPPWGNRCSLVPHSVRKDSRGIDDNDAVDDEPRPAAALESIQIRARSPGYWLYGRPI